MIGAGIAMVITVAGALLAAGARNIVHAVFGLGVCLCGVALAFLMLGSPFVAAMEVLIYIGGITVAMVFAVMLSGVGRNEPREGGGRVALGALAALVFFGAGLALILGTKSPETVKTAADAWSVEQIGRDLLDRFNLVFEILSVVLFLAIVGAIGIAARSDDRDEPVTDTGGEGAA